MTKLLLAAFLLLSLFCAWRTWGIAAPAWVDDDDQFVVLRTVTPAPSPTPREDCRITPSKVWRGLCR